MKKRTVWTLGLLLVALLISPSVLRAGSCQVSYDACASNCVFVGYWNPDPTYDTDTCVDGCWCQYQCQCNSLYCADWRQCGARWDDGPGILM